MQAPTSNDRQKATPLHKLVLLGVVIVAVIIVLITVSVVIPLSMTDGTEKYSGVEVKAAQGALDVVSDWYRGIDGVQAWGTMRFRVESVRPVGEVQLCNNGAGGEKEPDRYEVVVGQRTIFGIELRSDTLHICDPYNRY